MLEATITKATVLEDQKTGKPTLFAVATYYDDVVNIKMPFDWDELDKEWFCKELREKLAEAFDLPLKQVDIRERDLLAKMAFFAANLKGTV